MKKKQEPIWPPNADGSTGSQAETKASEPSGGIGKKPSGGVIGLLERFVGAGQAAQRAVDGAIEKASGSDTAAAPAAAQEPASPNKSAPRTPKTSKSRGKSRAPRPGTLAAIIDIHLMKGENTIADIALAAWREGHSKIPLEGKDIKANVRARMVHYRRKGWKVILSKEKIVQMKPPNGGRR